MKLHHLALLAPFFGLLLAHLLIPSSAATNQQDVNALNALLNAWSTVDPSWKGDPCDNNWLGIICSGDKTTVTELHLANFDIVGYLPPQIGNFVNLQYLDLSYNTGLTGTIPSQLYQLTNLSRLYLQNCGFYGFIKEDLGNLVNLKYLALNGNNFTGPIPDNIGKLSQLFWFDISDNQFTGNLPTTLGQLIGAKHFHFNSNNLSGIIPEGIFNPEMMLIHLLLNSNQFVGPIPADLGNLTHLDILQLDSNQFSTIPVSLQDLTKVTAVLLNNNDFTGDLPDFTSLVHLQILDLSYNNFTPGPIPTWFSSLPNLQSLAMESGHLEGAVPSDIFAPLNLSLVRLGYNNLSGTLDLRESGPSLSTVDLQQNSVSNILVGSYSKTLNLQGNPICQYSHQPDNACSSPTEGQTPTSSTPSCGCKDGFVPNPTLATLGTCQCAYPVSGLLIFIALKVTLDSKIVPTLQSGIAKNIPLITTEDQVSISIASTVVVNISIFPSNADAWDASHANLITTLLSSKSILFPTVGPYEYLPSGFYSPPGNIKSSSLNISAKIGIVVGVAAVVVIVLFFGGYAYVQKRRADRAEEMSRPFASWMTHGEDKGDALKFKGARLFTLSEMKKATNNFSKSNEIGAGGYGKVYKGVLSSGEQVAIKKAQASSQQGAAEFKNEIELLSRVHHKNLVGLLGFCFEEQMLVYEYMPNGTLRDCLSGRTNLEMNWRRRLAIAVGSARGLAYLHTEANPPIIHRDVKSSNILLDEKLTAKVADFGLSKLAPDDGGTGQDHVSTQVKGTLGYLDPEYYSSRRLSDKSDVYSFGVVLLEIITAKQPISHGKFIVREVRTALERGGLLSLQRLLDPTLNDCPKTDLREYLDVALRCVQEAAAARPTMKEAAKELEAIISDADPGTEKSNSVHKLNEESPFHYSGRYGVSVNIEPK